MIVAGIILAWFGVSIALLIGLAWASSRRVPKPQELFAEIGVDAREGFCDEAPARADLKSLREAIA